MSELANYSIETDNVVLLSFTDGRKLRVPVTKLQLHLAPPDLEKVKVALKLRQDFIRNHMPKVLLILVAGGLLALVATAGIRVIAELTRPKAPTNSAPGTTNIVRSIEAPAPSASPTKQPKVEGDSTVAVTTTPTVVRPTRQVQPPAPWRVVAQAPTPTPTPAPQPSPTPVPDGSQLDPPVPTPTPNPAPTPQIPNQGKVLGDSTGPAPTPTP